jgi:hypothetical protein
MLKMHLFRRMHVSTVLFRLKCWKCVCFDEKTRDLSKLCIYPFSFRQNVLNFCRLDWTSRSVTPVTVRAKPSISVSISNFNFQTFWGSIPAYPISTWYADFIASENLCQRESCLFLENESAVVFAVYNPQLAASLGYIKLPSNQVSLCNSSASLHF